MVPIERQGEVGIDEVVHDVRRGRGHHRAVAGESDRVDESRELGVAVDDRLAVRADVVVAARDRPESRAVEGGDVQADLREQPLSVAHSQLLEPGVDDVLTLFAELHVRTRGVGPAHHELVAIRPAVAAVREDGHGPALELRQVLIFRKTREVEVPLVRVDHGEGRLATQGVQKSRGPGVRDVHDLGGEEVSLGRMHADDLSAFLDEPGDHALAREHRAMTLARMAQRILHDDFRAQEAVGRREAAAEQVLLTEEREAVERLFRTEHFHFLKSPVLHELRFFLSRSPGRFLPGVERVQVPIPHEALVAPLDAFLEGREEVGGEEHGADAGFGVELDAEARGGAGRGPVADGSPFQAEHAEAGFGQLEGGERAVHAGADDDDVVVQPPIAGRHARLWAHDSLLSGAVLRRENLPSP